MVGNSIFFIGDDGNVGQELWRYDAGGTVSLVSNLDGRPDSSNIEGLIPGADGLYFWAQYNATDETFGANNLYSVDRVTGSITHIFSTDFLFDGEPPHNMVEDTTTAGGRVYYPYVDTDSISPANNIELGFGDSNTVNINQFDVELDAVGATNDGSLGYSSGEPFDLVELNGKLYFTASRSVGTYEGIDENGDSVPVDSSGFPFDSDYPFSISEYAISGSYEYRGIVELDPSDNSFHFVVGERTSPSDLQAFDIGFSSGNLIAVSNKLLFLDGGAYGNGGIWTYDPATGTTEQLFAEAQITNRVSLDDGSVATLGTATYLAYNDLASGRELYVLSEATAPIANAGGPYTGTEGRELTLDGSGSSDSETLASGLLFEWDLDYNGSAFEIDATGVQPNVSFADDFGARNIALRVTDPGGLSDLSVTTLEMQNAPPVIQALPDATGQAGQAIVFSVSASDAGTNDTLTYTWDFGQGDPQSGVNLTAPTHTYPESGAYSGTLTITDNSGDSVQGFFDVVIAAPVAFTVAEQTVNESAGTVTATLALDAPATSPITVPFTIGGTASGDDHDLADGNITIGRGESSADIVVTIEDDVLDEIDAETIVISLGTPAGASLGAIASHQISITDNDAKPIAFFSQPFVRLEEDFGSTATVTVQLDQISGRDISVPLELSGSATIDSDYTIDTHPIVIPAGSQSASATVTLINDVTPEPAEIIQLSMLPSEEVSLSTNETNPTTQIITIAQNDQPQVWFDRIQWSRREGDGHALDFGPKIRVSKASDSDIIVPFTVTGDTDRITVGPMSGTVTIPAGSLTGTFEYDIADDQIAESLSTVVLMLGSPSGAALGPITQSELLILDDDIPSATITTTSPNTLFESAGQIPITVQLDQAAVQDIEFKLSLSTATGSRYAIAGEDYLAVDGPLVIPQGETRLDRMITLIDDNLHESTEQFSVTLELQNAFTAEGLVAVQYGPQRSLEFSLRDNDPLFRPFSIGPTTFNEGVGTVEFGVEVIGDAEGPVTVTYSARGDARQGADFTLPTDSSMTIAPGETMTSSFTVVDDTASEPNEAFKLEFESLIAQPRQGGGLTFDELNYQITDNDAPAPSLSLALVPSASSGLSLSGNQAAVREGDRAKVRVSLSRPSAQPITFQIGTSIGYGLVQPGGAAGFRLSQNDTESSDGSYTIPAGQLAIDLDVEVRDDKSRTTPRLFNVRILSANDPAQINGDNPTGSLALPSAASKTILVRDNDASSTVPTENNTPADSLNYTRALQIPIRETPVAPGTSITPDFATSSIDVNSIPTGLQISFNSQNGFIEGATAFFDANFNGIADFLDVNGDGIQQAEEPLERVATTDAEGNFIAGLDPAFDLNADGVVDASEGQWTISGGTDISKNLPLLTPISAPAGMFVINGISTLATKLIHDHGMTLEAAKQRLAEAFGLSVADLGFRDNVRAAAVNDQEGNRSVVANAQIMDTVALISRTYAALSDAPDVPYFSDILFGQIASLVSVDGSSIDLTSPLNQSALIASVANETGFSLPTADTDAAATVIAAGNGYIQSQLTGGDTSDLLENVVRAQIVAQADVATALEDLAMGNTDASAVTSAYTGNALETLIAGTTPGTIVPPAIIVRHAFAEEGDSGTTNLTFQVDIIGTPTEPVSVEYQTVDGTATVADGDYIKNNGTLNWEIGDTSSRFVVVAVQGDSKSESTETISLILDSPIAGVLRSDVAHGYVVDDDAIAIDEPIGNISDAEFVFVELEPADLSNKIYGTENNYEFVPFKGTTYFNALDRSPWGYSGYDSSWGGNAFDDAYSRLWPNPSVLWSIDPITQAYSLVDEVPHRGIQELVVANDKLFYTEYLGDGERKVYAWDGPGASPRHITTFSNDNQSTLWPVDDRVYFTKRDSSGLEPWVTDGTHAGTFRLEVILGLAESVLQSSVLHKATTEESTLMRSSMMLH